MSVNVKPFLMFQGKAEEAMELYVSLFPGARIIELVRHGPDGSEIEGTVARASFRLGDQEIRCFDSRPVHAFTFTPSFSFFVDFDSEEELRTVLSALADGGQVHMELANYGFSRKYAWISDRFGVSWQLNLP